MSTTVPTALTPTRIGALSPVDETSVAAVTYNDTLAWSKGRTLLCIREETQVNGSIIPQEPFRPTEDARLVLELISEGEDIDVTCDVYDGSSTVTLTNAHGSRGFMTTTASVSGLTGVDWEVMVSLTQTDPAGTFYGLILRHQDYDSGSI